MRYPAAKQLTCEIKQEDYMIILAETGRSNVFPNLSAAQNIRIPILKHLVVLFIEVS